MTRRLSIHSFTLDDSARIEGVRVNVAENGGEMYPPHRTEKGEEGAREGKRDSVLVEEEKSIGPAGLEGHEVRRRSEKRKEETHVRHM